MIGGIKISTFLESLFKGHWRLQKKKFINWANFRKKAIEKKSVLRIKSKPQFINRIHTCWKKRTKEYIRVVYRGTKQKEYFF